MDKNQKGRMRRALEVLNEKSPEGPRDTDAIIGDLASRVGKLDYWLRDILSLVGELDSEKALNMTDLARKYGG